MYYNEFNRPEEDWGRPIETTARPADGTAQPKKKKHSAVKIVALCLVCALVGGFSGVGVMMATGAVTGRGTTMYQGATPMALNPVTVSEVSTGKSLSAAQIYAAFVGSTVGITTEITTNVFGQPVSSAAAGSGFVITADGYIVTNYHVIKDAKSIKVSFVDGKSYDATLVGGEEENDIAVLKIEATGLAPVVIGNSDSLTVGEQVFAIGNPLGELTFSLTGGYVSAKDRNLTMSDGSVMNYIQTDTAINSGNSGGPLFNVYGQVIGITSAKLSNSGASSSAASIEGLGFAIPIDDVKGMVQDIIAHGYVTGKPYLGITVTTVPESVAQEYGMSQGALVKSVDSTSCAAKAGIKEGDIITSIGGKAIISSAELIEQKKTYKAGATTELTVDRDGEKLAVSITFDEDTPQRQAAQQKELEDQQVQQQQQQQEQYANEWPFGGFPWFY